MTDRITIPAIHDDDLEKLLIKFNLFEKVKRGELKCHNCDNKITWDNIYGLMMKENSPILFCDSLDCLEKLNNQ